MTRPRRLGSDALVVLVGASGAGKSTWAADTFSPDGVVSSDALRVVVAGTADDQRAGTDAFDLLERVVAARAGRGLPTCIDTLGTDAANRRRWAQVGRAAGLRPVAVLVPVTAAEARRRNEARARAIPRRVHDRQVRAVRGLVDQHTWDDDLATSGALLDEGFDEVRLARPTRLVPPSLAEAGTAFASTALASTALASTARASTARASTAPPSGPVSPAGDAVRDPRGTGADAFRDPDGRLRLGLHLSRFDGVPSDELGDRLAAVARAAERAGISSLWVMDHFQQIPQVGRTWDPMLEATSTLAHLAAATERIRIGTLVAGITHRNVAVLGQTIATLDVLSGGRVTCGLGLAWYEREHRDLGMALPINDERYALLGDALDGLPRLWGPGTKPWSGAVLEWAATTCYPRPLQERVPLLVGGQGRRRTLPLVGAKADACNLFGEPDEVEAKIAIVRRAAVEAGRNTDDVAVTTLGPLLVGRDDTDVAEVVEAHRHPSEADAHAAERLRAGTVDDHLARLERFRAVGVDEAIVHLPALDVGLVERLGPLVARLSR